MLSEEQNNNKNIKITLSIIIFIMFIELVLAGLLFINYKKNRAMLGSNGGSEENKLKLISGIEKEAIYKKEENLNEEKNNDPRTRPLPSNNSELQISQKPGETTETPGDPRTRPLPN